MDEVEKWRGCVRLSGSVEEDISLWLENNQVQKSPQVVRASCFLAAELSTFMIPYNWRGSPQKLPEASQPPYVFLLLWWNSKHVG